MSTHAPTLRDRANAKWLSIKPIATGLVIGLVAGPIISGFSGFQVRTSTAEAAVRAGVLEQQAMFCAARAKAATPDTATLGWQARSELARQHAIMPGSTTADPDVVYACSNRLAN